MTERVKRCRKGHVKAGTRCLTCKANNERKRYWGNPEKQRTRKKHEYHVKIDPAHALPPKNLRRTHLIDGDRMKPTEPTEPAKSCSHDNANQLDDFPGVYYCIDEDIFFDLDGAIVPSPYEDAGGSHAGKAKAPASTGAKSPSALGAPKPKSPPTNLRKQTPLPAGMKRAYKRDESLMETVKCSHQGCKRTFKMWPQNIKPEGNYCPEEHRPLQRLAQAAERQKRFREKHQ